VSDLDPEQHVITVKSRGTSWRAVCSCNHFQTPLMPSERAAKEAGDEHLMAKVANQ
jgi:hypothetical protein